MTDPETRAALDGLQTLALTLWGEARGEPVEGRIAVGCVIRNRATSGRFGGGTIKAVCLAPAQFSCWRPVGGEANYAQVMAAAERLLDGPPLDAAVLRECLWIADGIVSGAALDRTKGADHYVTRTLYASAARPAWIAAMTVTGVIGDHVFLRSRPTMPGVMA